MAAGGACRPIRRCSRPTVSRSPHTKTRKSSPSSATRIWRPTTKDAGSSAWSRSLAFFQRESRPDIELFEAVEHDIRFRQVLPHLRVGIADRDAVSARTLRGDDADVRILE